MDLDLKQYSMVPFKVGGADLNGWDCWGCVRYICREEFNKDLPAAPSEVVFEEELVTREIMRTVIRFKELFQRVDNPQLGDVVLLQPRKRPIHVGVVISTTPVEMMHAEPEVGTIVEEVFGLAWGKRIEGFYRYNA